MVSQVFMIAVLWPLTKKQEITETMEMFGLDEDEVAAADWDEEADLQARIWM